MSRNGATPQVSVGPLLTTVVDGGYCIGCGACASLVGSPLEMRMNEFGQYQPVVVEGHHDAEFGFDVGRVCPFYSEDENETTIGRRLYPEIAEDRYVGRYRSITAGHVQRGSFRGRGSSGGITTWLLVQLLNEGLIDGVVHVSPGSDRLFAYSVSLDEEEIVAGAKSRYYPVEMSAVMEFVRSHPGRYAFVGVPCFVKAVRLLALNDIVVEQSVAFCLAIFCGHLKSAAYAEMLAWQLGVQPGDLTGIDFRVKLPGRPASRYGVGVTSATGTDAVAPVHDLFGTDWGEGLFKPQACDFCDDVAGEAADATMGDAWLPEYQHDEGGTNVLITRHPVIADIVSRARASGELRLDELTPHDVYRSQAGNYRHRRDGLSYRLWERQQRGMWHPPKRVPATQDHVSRNRRRIYQVREKLSSMSHIAFLEAKRSHDMVWFAGRMEPLLRKYRRLYHPPMKRLARSLRRTLTRWSKRT